MTCIEGRDTFLINHRNSIAWSVSGRVIFLSILNPGNVSLEFYPPSVKSTNQ